MMTINRLALGQRGFYFGLGLAVGLGFAAHGAAASSLSTPCRGGSAAKQPAPVHAASATHQAQLFVSGQHRWWLTLERAAVVSQVQGTSATYHARGKYVVVFLLAQNVGKVPQTLYFDQSFALADAQGRQFSTASGDADTAAAEQYKRDDSIDAVQPSFSAHVSVIFDVAPDAHGFTLVNVPLFADHGQKLFSLGI